VTGLLTATEVERRHDLNSGVKMAVPLQAIDPGGTNVTVLGLVVGISNATLIDDNVHTITGSQLLMGQFVHMDLLSNQAPLSATRLVAETGINPVHVYIKDSKGKLVNDASADIKAEVTFTIANKVQKIQITSKGGFLLVGLPAGTAKISVTRVHDGKTSTAKASFKVKADVSNQLNIKLKASQ